MDRGVFVQLCHINAGIWLCRFMVGRASISCFSLARFLLGTMATSVRSNQTVRFVIVYLTCDDFVSDACLSCLSQEYPQNAYHLLVCDDSREGNYLAAVSQFARQHRRLHLVRRPTRDGFKAGNLNHAVRSFTNEADESDRYSRRRNPASAHRVFGGSRESNSEITSRCRFRARRSHVRSCPNEWPARHTLSECLRA